MISNGDKVKDKVTGFEGTVTGVAEYLTGCRQVLIQPPVKDGEFKDGRWMDDGRLEVTGTSGLDLSERQRDGGPQSNAAPIR